MAERCSNVAFNCPYKGKKTCILTRHHVYWPAREYTSELEDTFRNLPENIHTESRCDHDEIHRNELPPHKPTTEQMIRAIAQSALEGDQYEQAA